MSKAAKGSILILIILLLVSLGFAGYTLLEKQKVEKENKSLSMQLRDANKREKKSIIELNGLKDQVKQAEEDKAAVQKKLQIAEKSAKELSDKVAEIEEESDKWKRRLGNIRKERDALVSKVEEVEKQRDGLKDELAMATALKVTPEVITPKPVENPVEEPKIIPQQEIVKQAPVEKASAKVAEPAIALSNIPPPEDDEYWAAILREKAALEVEIEGLNEELSRRSIEMVELKQINSELQIELDSLKSNKDDISQEIEYKEDLVNNLSLELARTKNDKQFVASRVEKLNEENLRLRGQIKQLMSSKTALEKSIVGLTQDKNKLQKQLVQNENVIQSKIDEIWRIKDSLDHTFKSTQKASFTSNANEVELPPIVVSSNGGNNIFQSAKDSGLQGRVVSTNDDNNFVIVDLGEGTGISLGDGLSVYRNSKYIARLEVIQVRKEISAADIKDQWAQIEVGDVVR